MVIIFIIAAAVFNRMSLQDVEGHNFSVLQSRHLSCGDIRQGAQEI